MTEETLGFDAIREAVTGEGHFLGGDHTLASMERDYYYPPLANRDAPAVWNEAGAPDAWQVAREKAQEILNSHHPQYIAPDMEVLIRQKFPQLR